MSNSSNLETNIKDDLDGNADDCDEAHWFEIDKIQLDNSSSFWGMNKTVWLCICTTFS